MDASQQDRARSGRTTPIPRGLAKSYPPGLCRRVAALRRELRSDTAAALERPRQDRRTYLDQVMSKLQGQLFFDFCVGDQKKKRALAMQRQRACLQQRIQVAQALHKAALQRATHATKRGCLLASARHPNTAAK